MEREWRPKRLFPRILEEGATARSFLWEERQVPDALPVSNEQLGGGVCAPEAVPVVLPGRDYRRGIQRLLFSVWRDRRLRRTFPVLVFCVQLVLSSRVGQLPAAAAAVEIYWKGVAPQVLRKPDGGSRGFGFVTFSDEVAVEKCLVMQHVLEGKQVEVKRAIRKEDMEGGAGGYGPRG
jgi:hypothetical protein